jgi:hypothetical protein
LRIDIAIVLRVADDPCEAPVEHVHLTVVAEHDVRRLEVSVDDVMRVRELDREAYIDERANEPLPFAAVSNSLDIVVPVSRFIVKYGRFSLS